MEAVPALADVVGVEAACAALGIPRASWYRSLKPRKGLSPRPKAARALSESERATVLSVLTEERFMDRSPSAVHATLLEEGTYHCSVRTMYRILAAHKAVRERRNQRRHPVYTKPELMAQGPNQVWSWDITKLKGPAKGIYFYLYVLMDIFSRMVVGWMVADRENANLAGRLISESCTRFGVQPDTLILHSDRGSPMTAKCTAQLLADLGVTRSLSRPHVSDDNPFSEAHFKTLKYAPTFPDRFRDRAHARSYCQLFMPWYNTKHRHSGIAMLAPQTVHFGRADQVLAQRQATLNVAFQAHPERFPNGPPKCQELPGTVWINPPLPAETPTPEVTESQLAPAPASSQHQELEETR